MKYAFRTIALASILMMTFASCDNGTSGETAGSAGGTGNGTGTGTGGTGGSSGTGGSGGATSWGTSLDVTKPSSPVRLIFIHHSCGQNWLANDNGGLGNALNDNNFYVSDTNYGWDAATGDNLGDRTNTENWPEWFTDTKMPYVYASSSHETWNGNDIAQSAGENEIIMFKSCYPCSEVGDRIDDEKTVYNTILTYFAAHQDKLFVLVTPPGEREVSSAAFTKELCDWLVNRETGWLKGYAHKNVLVYDFYCTLSETDATHTVSAGSEKHDWGMTEDRFSAYPSGDNHPNATGNRKATADFIPLLNAAYNYWK